MVRQIRPALVIFAMLSLLTGVFYPLMMTWIANTAFPVQAQGSVLISHGHPVGSALIGQNFTTARYFHPRPSATNAADPMDPSKTVASPYNGAASLASNLGPTSRVLIQRVSNSAKALATENPDAIVEGQKIPTDLVTTSGSGLDPDITPKAALFQVDRVARARNLPTDKIRVLVERMIQVPLMGWLGEPHVNVLELNLALDTMR